MTFVVVIRRDDDTVEDHRNMELAKLPLVPIFASATTLSRKRETASARLRTKPCLSIVDQRSAEFQLHLPLVNSSLIDRGFLPGVRQFFARESSLSLSLSLSLSGFLFLYVYVLRSSRISPWLLARPTCKKLRRRCKQANSVRIMRWSIFRDLGEPPFQRVSLTYLNSTR